MDGDSIIEDYLRKPVWVIDILPKQVPANGHGQYFKIADYYLEHPQIDELLKRFHHLLIKLNCYNDFSAFFVSPETGDILDKTDNPKPSYLGKWLLSGKPLHVVLPSEEAMLSYHGTDHYMALYNPNDKLLELVTLLASSEGLFVWKP